MQLATKTAAADCSTSQTAFINYQNQHQLYRNKQWGMLPCTAVQAYRFPWEQTIPDMHSEVVYLEYITDSDQPINRKWIHSCHIKYKECIQKKTSKQEDK